MPGRAYSRLFGFLPSVSDPTLVGSPPAGRFWVLRMFSITFGAYFGAFVYGGVALAEDGPWAYLAGSGKGEYFNIHPNTWIWEGRIVIPGDKQLWVKTDSGDTGDILCSGYELLGDGYGN